jgi:hypothetical protein
MAEDMKLSYTILTKDSSLKQHQWYQRFELCVQAESNIDFNPACVANGGILALCSRCIHRRFELLHIFLAFCALFVLHTKGLVFNSLQLCIQLIYCNILESRKLCDVNARELAMQKFSALLAYVN